MSEQDVKEFLAHYGVKGMKWGVRGTRRVQRNIDRTKRVAEGTATLRDRLGASGVTRKGAQKRLQRGANEQAKMLAGKRRVQSTLLKASGVRIQDLNYGVKGDANAKMDRGQKAVVGLAAAFAAVNVATVLANS